jgi:hypothetical protein
MVVDHRVGRAEQAQRLDREEFRIAGTGADEIDGADPGGWCRGEIHVAQMFAPAVSSGSERAGELEDDLGEFVEGLPDRLPVGADFEVGGERRLVGRVDAGEQRDLAGARPLVELLGIAALALGERGVDEDLGEGDAALPARSAAMARSARNGEISAAITTTPASARWRASSVARRRFSRRSSGVKPRFLLRPVRRMSPSRTAERMPERSRRFSSAWASVDLPEPDRPVIQTRRRGGRGARSGSTAVIGRPGAGGLVAQGRVDDAAAGDAPAAHEDEAAEGGIRPPASKAMGGARGIRRISATS